MFPPAPAPALFLLAASAVAVAALNPLHPFHLVASTTSTRTPNPHDLPDVRPISILPNEPESGTAYQPLLAGTGIHYTPAHSSFALASSGLLHSPACGTLTRPPSTYTYTPCNSTGAHRGQLLEFYNGAEGPQAPRKRERRWSLQEGYLLAFAGDAAGFVAEDVDEKGDAERAAVFWRSDGGEGLGCRMEYGVSRCNRTSVFLHAYARPFRG